MAAKEIKALTGLRGVAALWVVFYHSYTYYQSLNNPFVLKISAQFPLLTNILLKGYMCVDVFFILSAFVLTMSYEKKFVHLSKKGYFDYLYKRFVRIYPLYFIVTSIFRIQIFLHPLYTVKHEIISYLSNLFFLQVLLPQYNINGVSWSLSTEFYMYLFLPFLITKLNVNYVKYLIVGAIGIVALPFIKHEHDINIWQGPPSFVRTFFDYLIGLSVYKIYRQKNFKMNPALKYALLILIIELYNYKEIFDGVLVLAIGFAMVNLFNKNAVTGLLSSKLIYGLGLISYSLYLNQFLFIHNNKYPFYINLILLIAFSILTYLFIEKKLNRVFNNLYQRNKTN